MVKIIVYLYEKKKQHFIMKPTIYQKKYMWNITLGQNTVWKPLMIYQKNIR